MHIDCFEPVSSGIHIFLTLNIVLQILYIYIYILLDVKFVQNDFK